jgi:hypothetical protein
LLAKVQGGNTARVFDKADDRKFPLLHGLDLQPVLTSLRPIRGVRPLGNDTLPIQLGGVLKHLLTVADEMFGKQHRKFDVVFAEQAEE